MGRRTKIITEYRQTGGNADADGDSIVEMGCGWVQNILLCHPLFSIAAFVADGGRHSNHPLKTQS